MRSWRNRAVLITIGLLLFWAVVYLASPQSALSLFWIPPASASLTVPFEEQQMDNWCCAASADMIAGALLHPATSQCHTVELGLPAGSICCPTGVSPGQCNVVGWPPFTAMGFDYLQTNNAALTYGQLRHEIGQLQRPVAGTWEYTDSNGARTGRGHMMVVIGYVHVLGESMVEMYDPLCPSPDALHPDPNPCGWKQIPYSEYDSGMLDNGTEYVHWNDYYAIQWH